MATLSPKVRAKPHMFMPGETITAAIKKYNLYDVSKDEMKLLLQQFSTFNPDPVMRPGMRVMVPILERHHAEVFKK